MIERQTHKMMMSVDRNDIDIWLISGYFQGVNVTIVEDMLWVAIKESRVPNFYYLLTALQILIFITGILNYK